MKMKLMGRQMRMRGTAIALFLSLLLPPFFVQAQEAKTDIRDIKGWALKTAEFKEWLDKLQGDGQKFWTRLDGSRRPHKLYVGDGFNKADFQAQEEFIEIFSHYLAGHPDKYMLIDLYDARTGAPVGEFGWAGFKLFPDSPEPAAPEKASTTVSGKPGAR
ncbi:MAG TPA: hypothetical protein VGA73_02560 [Candidatus Binatia bacterium]